MSDPRTRPEPTPPAAWDEWAMRRANEVYDRTVMLHMGSDSRCRAAIHVALIDAMQFAAAAERERCAKAVPGNWTDPLLTGPDKVVPTGIDCEVVERLLLAVRDRIRKGDAA